MLVLLVIVSIALLSLSSVTLRTTSRGDAQAIARANARLALMIALGELQKQMGPDMRVSAEAALFDTNQATASIEGVAQPHWLASYNSWGTWLNGTYSIPDGGGSAKIQDTYTPQRKNMFRRWLLSIPDSLAASADAPLTLSGWDDSNSVIMVGKGSLGDLADAKPEKITRAYLKTVGTNGKQAWWIGSENQKAKINLAKKTRNLTVDAWQASQGNTAEVGVGVLDGFDALDEDDTVGDKLITTNTLRPAAVEASKVQSNFYDISSHSRGVITSVRTGQLKKDLSLLFERSSMGAPFQFNPGSDIREPSIRPMSSDLMAKNPQLPNRHFQSWTDMRHYYRMYRSSSDATIGETGGGGNVRWTSSKPWTDVVSSVGVGKWGTAWNGSNNYWRTPILAKITFVYSLLAEPHPTQIGKFNLYHTYNPVFTLWNPYNVEMRIPDKKLQYLTSAYKCWPNTGAFFLGNTVNKTADQMGAFGTFGYSQSVNTQSYLSSGNGTDIIFKPGELRVFSHKKTIATGADSQAADMLPGFDPQAIGGEKKLYGIYTPAQNPGVTIQYSHNYWGGNINYGNTCGSLCMVSWYDRASNPGAMPTNYAHDWLNKSQRLTEITPPGTANIARWVYDGRPYPIAFSQLVIKGLSEFNYESISWDKDWRSRNWIQAPPSYFGGGMYISEDATIAHTQRVDNPYVVFFGPTSMSEMPKVVGQVGQNSFFGSGSSPFEKVTAIPSLELPSAPISSLAGFSGMRINPGWVAADQLAPGLLSVNTYGGNAIQSYGKGESLYAAETKEVNYQSGVTGPGIGNSFIHPMLPRTDIYKYYNNSVSQDILDRSQPDVTAANDTKAYSDFWDHVFVLNDALWDDYYVSSLADQKRPGASASLSLSQNLDRFMTGEPISNSRYNYRVTGKTSAAIKTELQAATGYLKSAKYLMMDGMFNVNSTSVQAWYALFAGIRERQLVFRTNTGALQKITVPSDKRIALSRFDTEVSDKEMDDPAQGVTLPDGTKGWSGVRYLDDEQLLKLAEECVKQVKQRGPFLNYAEFINRRLSADNLGLMGALQSAIDYDDKSPDSKSINYRFKNGPSFMLEKSQLGQTDFATPEAAEGSRFAGIPGYVIQSDLLKPIANTLSVRDDTFRIRAYGEALDANGKVSARAWCEALVQRTPDYIDPKNEPDIAARNMSANGAFSDNSALTALNRRFGRKFQIESFRWLNSAEV